MSVVNRQIENVFEKEKGNKTDKRCHHRSGDPADENAPDQIPVEKVAAQNCRAGGSHGEFASLDGFWQKAVYNKSAEHESNRSQYGRADFGRR